MQPSIMPVENKNNGGFPERLNVKGSLKYKLIRADGTVEEGRRDNLIVSVGFDAICDSIGNSSSRPAVMGYVAIGTSTTAASSGQTALVAEVARVAASYAHTTGTQVFTLSSTFNPGTGTGAITEAGILNAASSGTMLDRVVFAVVNKGAGDTLITTFTFTLS